ncbi:MAG TPA: type VII secretion protein EccCb, partial [Egibacteraceae bacterium]
LERLSDAAPRVHQVWLPPLTAGFGLDALLGGLQPDPHRGLVPPHWPGVGRLLVPVGVVDRPDEQAQHVHALDLAGAGGNVAVVGAPQTGKSTTLRTIVCALALTHAPTEVQVYAIDHGGGGLDALADLPHVGTVAGRRDGELTARIIRHVAGVVAAREQRFAELGVDSMATLRARLAQGTLDEPFPDVFLVIDGWASLRSQHPELEAAVTDLATRGLGYGVHVLLSSNRWMELRAGLRDGFGAAVELRLSDAIESSVNRKTAETVPADTPGRGLTPDGHHLQVALPCVDGRSDDVAEGVRDLVARVAAAWAGPAAPPVRLLPEKVLFTDLPTGGTGVPVGIGEHELAPVLLDFDGPDPHLCVFGDGESGKTSVLRALVTGLLSRCSPDEARFVVVDYRRTLLEVVPDSHLLAYAGAAPAAAEACSRFRETLHRRMPGPDVTAAQLRARSWWSGPRLYLVVDDYDLVVNPTGNPLAPLVELLAQGRDLGFSVLLARRAAGTNRALDPFLQRLRDLATPGLLLSGDPAEGPLLAGMRAQPQPPGRGVLVRRGAAPELVQTAWVPELHAS